jgi:hypothetical protein
MTPLDFAHQLLRRLGLPESDSRLQGLVAVQAIEGGGGLGLHNTAWFNPLNTMWPVDSFGWKLIPTAKQAEGLLKGIKAFASWDDGVEATARTISQSNMKGILDALRRDASADDIVRAWGQSPWGWTKDAASKVGKAATYFAYYAHKEFPGGGGFSSLLPPLPNPVEAIKDLFNPKTKTSSKVGVIMVGVGALAGIAMLIHVLKRPSKKVVA